MLERHPAIFCIKFLYHFGIIPVVPSASEWESQYTKEAPSCSPALLANTENHTGIPNIVALDIHSLYNEPNIGI
jgi:hypothetical protein